VPPDRTEAVDLDGIWRVHPAEGELRRDFTGPDFDDSSWETLRVPGHWRSTPAFAECDGPFLYRRLLDHSPLVAGRRAFLELDGCFYFADSWLDGTYLGATEGYFAPHVLEVTELVAAPPGAARLDPIPHVLAIEVACPPQTDRTAKRLVTGVFSHWDCLDPEWNPGGIWRSVRVRSTGRVRIARCRVTCLEAGEALGRLACELVLDAREIDDDSQARLRVAVRAPDGTQIGEHDETITLAEGENSRRVELRVDDPPRWWPRRLGDQPMCAVDVAVEHGGDPSDVRALRTAFRDVRWRDWQLTVNGEPMFVMGSNHGPTRMALADATPADVAADVELAQRANLDMLRVHAHVARPELYDAADDAGLLLWQDFPLQWSYARGVRKPAVRLAAAMVDELAHHPSIVLWCAHNEPLSVDLPPGSPVTPAAAGRVVVSMALPTWNKDVLDRSVARALRRADATRAVVRHSGIFPGPASTGTDSHLYFGWYYGTADQLAEWLRRWPRLGRFVSELGAQAVPDSAEFMEPARWPDLDWRALAERHALQRFAFDRFVPPDAYDTFDDWRDATQRYQAALVQLQVEDIRRLRGNPARGFLQFCFADAHPAVTWSVLDHERTPKRAYAALRDACRPVLGLVDPRTGNVHVVSEAPDRLDDAVVSVDVDGRRRSFSGSIEPRAVTFVGRAEVSGARAIEVIVEHPGVGRVVNAYSDDVLALVS
jgi:beta-mannosidase